MSNVQKAAPVVTGNETAAGTAFTPAAYRQGMEQLIEVVQELSLARDLDTVMCIVRRAARELTGADGATFVLRDDNHCFYAEENAVSPLWKGRRFPMDVCISGWVMLNRQPTVIHDVYSDPRIPVDAYRPTFVRSLAMVPIRTRDPVGAIGNYWSHPYNPSPEQVHLLQALADTTAVTMENVQVYAELEQRVQARTAELESANRKLRREISERRKAEAKVRHLSLLDELTGLYNRRGFFLLADRQLRLARRAKGSGWLLFADLDGLKLVNDELGHKAGDRLIVNAARLLRSQFRDSDIVARLGGDEFVVFVQESGEPCEDIRGRVYREVEQLNRSRHRGFPLSLSMGAARWGSAGRESLEELLCHADAAMYAEKQQRRNAANRLPLPPH